MGKLSSHSGPWKTFEDYDLNPSTTSTENFAQDSAQDSTEAPQATPQVQQGDDSHAMPHAIFGLLERGADRPANRNRTGLTDLQNDVVDIIENIATHEIALMQLLIQFQALLGTMFQPKNIPVFDFKNSSDAIKCGEDYIFLAMLQLTKRRTPPIVRRYLAKYCKNLEPIKIASSDPTEVIAMVSELIITLRACRKKLETAIAW